MPYEMYISFIHNAVNHALKNKDLKKIIFIGGIHGSGKGEICNEITSICKVNHLIASEVLKWDKISDQTTKEVSDIIDTQNRLINNLNKIIKKDETYLLDGHYCLLNKLGQPEKIPFQTFKDINPIKLILVIADSVEIKKRLENRDSKIYNLSLIEKFQNLEISYARDLSKILSVPFLIVDSVKPNFNDLLNFIK